MLLEGNSLGKRQKDLNLKVYDAAAKNVPVEQIDGEEDTTDVYNLFKIDLASKYKEIDYILKVLKSGDGLQITRALKCIWLYDDEYCHLINPNFLHNEVFPSMSNKMRKNFLKTISNHLRNNTRAQDFFQYCMKENLSSIAFKFLIFTSLDFKTNFIENNGDSLESMITDDKDIVFLIGNDFSLAELYQSVTDVAQDAYNWFLLRHLYFIDPERYLKNWETYFYDENGSLLQSKLGRIKNGRCLGLRISKDVMTKHKQRVLKYIKLYSALINNSILRKYSTTEDAKLYAVGLLPENPKDFWKIKYKEKYEFILNLIPEDSKYDFLKKIFKSKYPKSEFEMAKEFYDQKYYKLMSDEVKESWALLHLANPNKTFLSNKYEDKEYLWYTFVEYDNAIKGIKKYIFTATCPFQRQEILNVLIQTVRNKEQLLKLIQYYYERHVNESNHMKESFIREILERYNLWEFNEDCWIVFNKLLHSIELYNSENNRLDCSHNFYAAAVYYHILHEKEFPVTLKIFEESGDHFYLKYYYSKIKEKKHQDIIYQYLIRLFTSRIKKCLLTVPFGDQEKNRINTYLGEIMNLQKDCNKLDEELPEIVLENMIYYVPKNVNMNRSSRALSQRLMLRYLKQDTQTVLDQIPLLRENFSKTSFDYALENLPQELFKIDTFLRKLKIYFPENLTQDFLKYFIESLSENLDSKNVFAAVHGIFVLAGESFKTEFMLKYAPADPKIDHSKLDRKHLYIQMAICRFVCYSRPPVSLDLLSLFIVGDYVKYFVPFLYMYMANCVPENGVRFVELLINSPVSIQKHGLKLAFKCLDVKEIKNVVKSIWNRSKNISLRRIIYTHLYGEVIKRKGKQQTDLFKVFLTLTTHINYGDHEDVINLLTECDLPGVLLGDFFEAAWITVNKFPKDDKNLNRRIRLINTITSRVYEVEPKIIRNIIYDYLNDIFTNINVSPNDDKAKFNKLNSAKFTLTINFIAYDRYDEEEKIKSVMPLVQYILNKCFEMWDSFQLFHEKSKTISRKFCYKFITELEYKHFKLEKENNVTFNVIFQNIAKQLLDFLPIQEVYLLIWRLRMAIVTNSILDSLQETEIIESQGREFSKMITNKYTSDIVKLINEFANQGNLSLTYMAALAKIVKRFLNILIKPTKTIRIEDAATFIADALVTHKSTECMLLAVHILPKKASSNSMKERQNVIICVKNTKSFEVQATYYQKMVQTWSTKGILSDYSESDSDC